MIKRVKLPITILIKTGDNFLIGHAEKKDGPRAKGKCVGYEIDKEDGRIVYLYEPDEDE